MMEPHTKQESGAPIGETALNEKKALEAEDTSGPDGAGSETEADLEAGTGIERAKTETDPNVVDWDGPDDPENPMNWSDKKKWLNIATLSVLTLVT